MVVKRIAACTHQPIIFNRFRAIARYWSEVATFYPLHLTTPFRVFRLEFRGKFGPHRTRIMQ